ncbi:hypothetical protein tb265_11170 [Gemmatimonadetes bacterium T265]|nr:hypothetical protein tb265_11170 [Gemmatimonadetes bacterium T265]
MTLTIPELALVVLVGPSGCGKSTFARTHFAPFETLSSDFCRGLVSNDENDQSATKAAFEVLHTVAAKRLERGLLTVVDATNVQPEARKPLVELARRSHVLPVAIVFDVPERLCEERNLERTDRTFGPHVIRQQRSQMQRSLRGLGREGFRHVHVLKSEADIAAVAIERQPLWNNKKHEHGPFDLIGDVHGCADELEALLALLGYVRDGVPNETDAYHHPDGRKAIFLGDLVDRGPRVPDVLRIAMGMVDAGTALAVPGNHDLKLVRKLRGRDVQITHGLADSLAQLEHETPEFRARVADFLDGLVSHYVLDGARLVVAHAGMTEEMQGRGSGKVRDFALYGETTGETDDFGLPVRYNWAAEYRGPAHVVYGHTPVPEPEWLNRTLNVDTGAVFGGRLTALRWPEKELVSVPAARVYAEPARPFLPNDEATAGDGRSAQHRDDDVASVADLKLAPFHVLATEGAVHADKDHAWHMGRADELCAADDTGVLFATAHRTVDLSDPATDSEATAWWEAMTERGGEGMVVKPLAFIARGRRGLVQPAVKCRGREYLRIIYGPEYTLPENLERLRARGLQAKRSLALREFALGIEGLERFVRREPLRRVHECVFGVLALESEPVDPRL